VRTGGLLDLIGTNVHALHRYALALDQHPIVLHRPGAPHEWSPGACATIYTAWQLTHDTHDPVSSNSYPAHAVGFAYDATWGTDPDAAPTWAACGHHTAFLALSASGAWHAAMPLAATGAVVRIVPLTPLKEALMATKWIPDRAIPVPTYHYVITFGSTRRLVQAPTEAAARAVYEVLVGWPVGSSIDDDEVAIRLADETDLYEFHPLRAENRNRLHDAQTSFFDDAV